MLSSSFRDCIQFCESNDIKWMPANLEGKTPCRIGHPMFKRIKEDGSISYVPHYIEFPTLSEKYLFKRQKFLLSDEMKAYVEVDNIRIGIDTFDVFQIDIDTEEIVDDATKEFLKFLDDNTAYYKSLTKSYGKHYFLRVADVAGFKDSILLHILLHKPDSKGYRLQLKNGKIGNVELLCGQWGYIKPNTTFTNADSIAVIDNDRLISLLDLPPIKSIQEMKPEDPTQDAETESVCSTDPTKEATEISRVEIHKHMLNIDQTYIDSRAHHFKIVCAIINYGYEDIALECMLRSSNTKNKNLHDEFNKFKSSNNGACKVGTLMYYSKISNESMYIQIIRESRNGTLKKKVMEDVIYLSGKNNIIDERYLPYDILDFLTEGDPEMPKCLFIKSHLGTGKTTILKQFIKAHPELKVLYFAPRISFARDIYKDLEEVGFSIYTDCRKKDFNKGKIITQLESAWKFNALEFDMVIIDEIESVLKQMTSFKTNKNIQKTYDTFESLVKTAKYVVGADAFLSNNSVDTIKLIRKDGLFNTIENTHNPYNRVAYETAGVTKLCDKASAVVAGGKNIIFITTQKTMGDKILKYFQKYNPDKKIAFYYGGMNEKTKRHHFENVNEIWNELNILIYTPVITCGVNFDPEIPHFHKMYMYITPYSCVVRDLFQSSLRVRKLIDNEVYYSYGYNQVDDNVFSLERKEFDKKNETLEDIEANLKDAHVIMAHYGLNAQHTPEWALKNLAYKIFEEQLGNKQLVATMNTYFVLCGYRIAAYGRKYDKYGVDDGSEKYNEMYQDFLTWLKEMNISDIEDIDIMEYTELQRRYFELTEKQKMSIAKYEYTRIVKDLIKNVHDTAFFQLFILSRDVFNHWVFEMAPEKMRDGIHKEEVIYEGSKKSIDDGITHCIMDMSYTKHRAMKKLLKFVYGKESIMELIGEDMIIDKPIGVGYKAKHNELEAKELLGELIPIFGLKHPQRGEDIGKYFNGCFKCIMNEYYGIQFGSVRMRIKKTNERCWGLYRKGMGDIIDGTLAPRNRKEEE